MKLKMYLDFIRKIKSTKYKTKMIILLKYVICFLKMLFCSDIKKSYEYFQKHN